MEQQEFANVWDALSDSPEEAANMTMRSNLMIVIQRKVAGWKAGMAANATPSSSTPSPATFSAQTRAS
jgi:hypothetical protein